MSCMWDVCVCVFFVGFVRERERARESKLQEDRCTDIRGLLPDPTLGERQVQPNRIPNRVPSSLLGYKFYLPSTILVLYIYIVMLYTYVIVESSPMVFVQYLLEICGYL